MRPSLCQERFYIVVEVDEVSGLSMETNVETKMILEVKMEESLARLGG